MNKNLSRLAVIAAALLFAGCSSTGTRKESAAVVVSDKGDVQIVKGSGAQTAGAAREGTWQGKPLDDPSSPLSRRKVYFNFDESTIKPGYVDLLRAHAEYLSSHPLIKVTIEGHGDERGSREYNIGLGERRANTVKRFLEAEGVDPAQLNTISYGEESPDILGHNEAAWSKNRRAVLVY